MDNETPTGCSTIVAVIRQVLPSGTAVAPAAG